MKKLILIALLLIGCGGADLRHHGPGTPLTRCESKPGWRDTPGCIVRGTRVPCLKVAVGPAVVKKLVTTGSCPSRMVALIQDSWQAQNDPDGSGTNWSVMANPYGQLNLQNLRLDTGDALYIATVGKNDKQDSSCCYVNVELK